MTVGWNDETELVVAGNGQVYFAPVGTTLPAKAASPTAALNAAFIGTGYLTEDGVTFNAGMDINDINAWQTKNPIRREKTAQSLQVSFVMQQYNETNLPLAFGGGVVTGSGPYSYTFPLVTDALQERSLVVDVVDGSTNYRFVFPRGTVTEAVESRFAKGTPALLPVTFRALTPASGGDIAYVNTDSAGFAAGS